MLKPLDLQTLMPRTIDLQRVQQIHNSRPIIDQHEYARNAEKQSQIRQEQVLQNEASSEGKRIHDDDFNDEKNRERRYRRYGQKKRTDEKVEISNQATDTERGQHIDIKI